MKRLDAIASLMIVSAAFAAGNESPLQPVADPPPILQELQRKMSPLRSVCLEFTQERHLKLFTEPLRSADCGN